MPRQQCAGFVEGVRGGKGPRYFFVGIGMQQGIAVKTRHGTTEQYKRRRHAPFHCLRPLQQRNGAWRQWNGPYAAPALSSAALSLLLTMEGVWHYSSVFLGGVYLGVKNRFTPYGVETETLPLPDALFQRLQETERELHSII